MKAELKEWTSLQENSSSNHGTTKGKKSLDNDFLPLKQMNAKLSALQLLAQDYSIETMPQWVGFTTTTVCNLKCPHCQTHGTEEARKIYNQLRWSGDTLTRIAEESLPSAYEFCLTLNGEPLSTPQIKKKLDELQQYGAKLHLTTNGTLFSKEMLIRLLPLIGTISISIDGATKLICEAIRLGANFERLLTNIRLFTRSCELLPDINPDIRLAFTVMGSNIRDMPEMVRVAHILKVPAIDFYPLIVCFPHVRDEDLKKHKPLYNAYYDITRKEAKRLNIKITMPAPFPGVDSDANARYDGTNVIIRQLPDDYYETLPPPESFLDHHQIEIKAAEIAAELKKQALNRNVVTGNTLIEGELRQMNDTFKLSLEHHEPVLEQFDEINYCENLYKRTFINSQGEVTPCCVPGRPVLGNIHTNSMKEIWNGDLYNNFRREFYSPNVPDVCEGCPALRRIPKQTFLNQILPDLREFQGQKNNGSKTHRIRTIIAPLRGFYRKSVNFLRSRS